MKSQLQVVVDALNKATQEEAARAQEEAARARQSKQERSAAAKHAVAARDANLASRDAQRHALLEECNWKVAAAVNEAERRGYGRGFGPTALAAYKRRIAR